jgi:Fe-S-cluster-containing dehydrogenase component
MENCFGCLTKHCVESCIYRVIYKSKKERLYEVYKLQKKTKNAEKGKARTRVCAVLMSQK